MGIRLQPLAGPPPRRWGARGLTLLELLVVVAILAVLATVAIRSTSDFGQQTRYDVTQSTLKQFRDAVLGPANQVGPNGVPMVTGFIADLGRPPRATLVNGVLDLPELYNGTLPTSPTLKAYSLYNAASSNITTTVVSGSLTVNNSASTSLYVPAGWRGPYISKSSALANIQDGWGKPLVSRIDLGTTSGALNTWPTMLLMPWSGSGFNLSVNPSYTAVTAANTDVLGWWTQSGFEGAPASSGDVYAGSWFSVISTNEYRIPLSVSVTVGSSITLAASSIVQVYVYGPDPNMGTSGKPVLVYAQEATGSSNPATFNFNGTFAPTIGVRVFRAFVRPLSTSAWTAGAPVYFPVRSGVQSVNVTVP